MCPVENEPIIQAKQPDAGLRVLIIDDQDEEVRLTESMLAMGGWADLHVDRVTTIAEGLETHGRKPFDVILLELLIPEGRGLNTVDRLRREAPDAPVIVLTRFEDADLAEEALRHGVEDYLIKSRVTPVAIARTVRYALARQQAHKALRTAVEQAARTRERAAVHELASRIAGLLDDALASMSDGATEAESDGIRGRVRELRQLVEPPPAPPEISPKDPDRVG